MNAPIWTPTIPNDVGDPIPMKIPDAIKFPVLPGEFSVSIAELATQPIWEKYDKEGNVVGTKTPEEQKKEAQYAKERHFFSAIIHRNGKRRSFQSRNFLPHERRKVAKQIFDLVGRIMEAKYLDRKVRMRLRDRWRLWKLVRQGTLKLRLKWLFP